MQTRECRIFNMRPYLNIAPETLYDKSAYSPAIQAQAAIK